MIYINGRFALQRITGVQRFANEVCRRLPAGQYHLIIPPKFASSGIVGHLWEQFVLPMKVRPGSLLLSMCNSGPLLYRNQLVVIHDAAPFDCLFAFSFIYRTWSQMVSFVLAHQTIGFVTVSKFSRDRLSANLHLCKERIGVVQNGLDFVDTQSVDASDHDKSMPDKYILCVGSVEPRKNLSALIVAWTRVVSQAPTWQLVIVGASNSAVFRQTMGTVPDGVIFMGYQSDVELSELYRCCHGFVFPSLYEGFGIPPIEALCYGAPRIAVSDIPALREFLPDNIRRFDPENVNDIENSLRDMLTAVPDDIPLATRLEYRKQYSWAIASSRFVSEIAKITDGIVV